MPRYFFSTLDGSRHHDTDGIELPNDAAARKEGIRFAGSVLANEPYALENDRDFRVEITNDRGELLFAVIALVIDTSVAAQPG